MYYLCIHNRNVKVALVHRGHTSVRGEMVNKKHKEILSSQFTDHACKTKSQSNRETFLPFFRNTILEMLTPYHDLLIKSMLLFLS